MEQHASTDALANSIKEALFDRPIGDGVPS
jgi:hypothetical protein